MQVEFDSRENCPAVSPSMQDMHDRCADLERQVRVLSVGSLVNANICTPPSAKRTAHEPPTVDYCEGQLGATKTDAYMECVPSSRTIKDHVSPVTPGSAHTACLAEGSSPLSGCGGKAAEGKGTGSTSTARHGPYDATSDRVDGETTSFGQGADGQSQHR